VDKCSTRVIDLVDQYHPVLLYFDDTVMPLRDVSDAGLRIAAHYYNTNMQRHGGKIEAVMTTKGLNEEQRRCLVWDIERGITDRVEPYPWQTDTCIGQWHYQRSLFTQHKYKSLPTVIQTLADVVSKNGNLLLNIPVRGDGTIDDDELKLVEGIAGWMDANRECIFSTRPWKVFGEGPATEGAALSAQGFNEGKGKPFTAADFRFTARGKVLYAIEMGQPTNRVSISSFGTSAKLLDGKIRKVQLLGSDEKLQWSQTNDALIIAQPKTVPNHFAIAFKITTK